MDQTPRFGHSVASSGYCEQFVQGMMVQGDAEELPQKAPKTRNRTTEEGQGRPSDVWSNYPVLFVRTFLRYGFERIPSMWKLSFKFTVYVPGIRRVTSSKLSSGSFIEFPQGVVI